MELSLTATTTSKAPKSTITLAKAIGRKEHSKAIPPRAFGAGLIALDLIVSAESSFRAHVGGTCGNVLTALAYLGWDSYPIARLGNDSASQVVRADLSKWGVHLDHTSCVPSAHTPIIVQQIRRKRDGTPTHSFSWACPRCGKRLPSFQPVTRAVVESIAPDLKHAQVFFMDRLSRGILELAATAADNGALVMYEPSGVAEPRFLKEAASIAHVVKYAEARLDHLESVWATGSATMIEIQTQGDRGLRYRHKLSGRRSGWLKLAAIDAPRLIDTCGSGDWCSAGFLAEIFRLQPAGLRKLRPVHLSHALLYGQALAAWNCGFEGARGGMYASTRAQLEKQIAKLLAGDIPALPVSTGSRSETEQPACPACVIG
jgi:sugar/nucleoside kinase (ribokinase family)